MKKLYIAPLAKFTAFTAADVVLASGDFGSDHGKDDIFWMGY